MRAVLKKFFVILLMNLQLLFTFQRALRSNYTIIYIKMQLIIGKGNCYIKS